MLDIRCLRRSFRSYGKGADQVLDRVADKGDLLADLDTFRVKLPG
jgi:hypothetical protein